MPTTRPKTGAAVVACVCVIMACAYLYVSEHTCRGGPGPEIRVFNDISQLSMAAEAFKEKFGFYPPSRFHVVESGNYGTSPLDVDSQAVIRKMFPEVQYPVDWNGDGEAGNCDVVLEGDQCLVFFLGGIPRLGFSKDPSHPAAPGGERIYFFEFQPDRLQRQPGGFLSYVDFFDPGRPYAYFSAGPQPGGYNRYGGSDCPRLGVSPYAQSWGPAPSFYNPDRFQIISAGRDGQFGCGTTSAATTWTPATARNIDPHGRDDICNFYSRRLGVPDQ